MRKIILAQNLVIAGLITTILFMSGFYEGDLLKRLALAAMGFIVADRALLEIERLFLKMERNNEKEGHRSNKKHAVSCVDWFKVRFSALREKNGNPCTNTAQILPAPGNNTSRQSGTYRRRNGC